MINNEIKNLSESYLNEQIVDIQPLKLSGSKRQYYRCIAESKKSILIVENEDTEENIAFMKWANFLKLKGIHVPEVKETRQLKFLICEDLGNTDLFQFLQVNDVSLISEKKLHNALQQLIKIQIIDPKNIDFYYPVPENTKEVILWDLYYFKYNFLKSVGQYFNEPNLENDFKLIVDLAQKNKILGLQYRDFQSRNIMLKGKELYFIDFQSIRKGDILYDAISLLYQSRLKLSSETIFRLKLAYQKLISKHFTFTQEQFDVDWVVQALMRTLQTLGAYGLRGIIEKKAIFIHPLAQSLLNLDLILAEFPIKLPEIKKISLALKNNEILRKYMNTKQLKINIISFSYKKGIPKDDTEHGGGFVFDCRSIHNPGRYEKYKTKTGKDKDVIDFFEAENEIGEFLFGVYYLVDNAIEKYLKRNFEYLAINFGCTGGQHRSVYSAENLNRHLHNKYGDKLNIVLKHRELV